MITAAVTLAILATWGSALVHLMDPHPEPRHAVGIPWSRC